MKIITIIPALNEEKFINDIVERALTHSDVMVVDDGSTDDTFTKATEAGAWVIKHEKNLGKGAAIKTGIIKSLNCKYDIIVIMDGDGQHDPEDIPKLISSMVEADIAIGSRFKNNNPKNMPLQRRLSNKFTTKLIKYVTGYHITDSQSGFRSISNSAAQFFINIPYNDYVYESEVLYQASKNKIKIKEQQISCSYKDEKSYITWINVLKYIFFIFKLILRKLESKTYSFRFKSFIGRSSKEN